MHANFESVKEIGKLFYYFISKDTLILEGYISFFFFFYYLHLVLLHLGYRSSPQVFV